MSDIYTALAGNRNGWRQYNGMNTSRTQAPTAGGASTEISEARAKATAARRRARMRSRAFSMIELLIVLQVIMILAGMAIPGLKTSRKQAFETSAVLTLRQLSDAQELYRPRQSPPTYANSLVKLRDAGLIDSGLADSTKSGYVFTVKDTDANRYAFEALAAVQGSTGDRSFYVDQSGMIRMAEGSAVDPFSPPLQ